MGTKPRAARAKLVLPEPDSPITPKVWPCRKTKLTSCKAVNFLGMNQVFTPPPETGYFTPKLQPCSMTGASAGGTTTSRIGWLLSNFWVYACCGSVSTSLASPCSTMTPFSITNTRSANRRTASRSWVISKTAMPKRYCKWSSRSKIWLRTDTSKAVVGSSAISKRGRQAKAMAIITRCLWPPESWCGYDFARRTGSAMPVTLIKSMASCQASSRVIPRLICSTSAICSPTENTGLRAVMGS